MKKVQAVIYDIKYGKPYFLILHRVLHWKGWEFPKGTVKKGEDNIETIKREIKEETGLKNFKIVKNLNRKIKFMWGKKKVVIVDVFLVKADMSKKIHLNNKMIEHDAYLWASKKAALERLTYKKAKDILKELKIRNE